MDLFFVSLEKNVFLSYNNSCYGNLRFRVKPNVVMATPKEVDFAQSSMDVEFWHGLFCYEKSEMEGKETFPLTEEGREAMIRYLKEHI